ncbi:unnamed protein product [Gemmata massiliana]|uniref:Uncharacterized protein n=1 Tax=Gemmata massiliana TaxID=1210884 RepID=A0A6P2CXW9_9BACT|nr:unnamed protein product [Gemmata massiliana]
MQHDLWKFEQLNFDTEYRPILRRERTNLAPTIWKWINCD